MGILFILLLLAQTFTIPAGITIFGPFPVQTANKYSYLELDRSLWVPGVSLTAQIQTSIDKGNTWIDACGFTSSGSVIVYPKGNTTKSSSCGPFANNVTHVRIITTVTGGDLVLPKLPNYGSKP